MNQEIWTLCWITYRPCWKRTLDRPRRATMWWIVYWCVCTCAGPGREPERKCRAGAGVELLESLQCELSVYRQNLQVRCGEEERGQAKQSCIYLIWVAPRAIWYWNYLYSQNLNIMWFSVKGIIPIPDPTPSSNTELNAGQIGMCTVQPVY